MPASTIVPTIERTICQQNALAVDLVHEHAVVRTSTRQRDASTRRTVVEPSRPLAAERREVVLADEGIGGQAQQREVERARAPTTRSGRGTGRAPAG